MPEKALIFDPPSEFWNWAARAIGAVIGSGISIAYLLPLTRREAALRFFTGIGVGLIFGTITGHKIVLQLNLNDALTPFEITLIGATTASLCAWWGLGVLARLASRHAASEKQVKKARER